MAGNKKRNYQKPVVEEVVNEPVIEDVEIISEEEIETQVETIQEEPVISEPVFGTVCNCYMLNIRNNPSMEADKVCTVYSKKIVKIIEELDNGWLNVELLDGTVGYCLAKYVAKMSA